jgi:hypothetical protein
MNSVGPHPELLAAGRNIAGAEDKYRAVEREALRISSLVATGEIAMAYAMAKLCDIAQGHGLCLTDKGRQDIEHIVREGLVGRATLMPEPSVSMVPVLPGWPVLEPDAHHGVVGDVVRTIEPHTESDPAALLIQFLVAVGNAIGLGPFYQIEGDLHFTKLNIILVGATSGGRKGTSLSRVLQVMELADKDWAQYRVQTGLASGEGLIHHVRDPVFKLKDGQMEEVDRGVPDKRLLIDAQEFASVLAVISKPGNTLSAVIRDAWGHRLLQTLGKASPEKATGSHISIVGHITDQELRRMMTRTELANGFANRFLFVRSRRSKKLPHGGSLDPAELARLGQRTKDAIEKAKNIGKVTMSPGAAAAWANVYDRLGEDTAGMVAEVTARAAPQIIRIALIYAVLDNSTVIELAHLKAGIAVWEYCEESARQLFGDRTGVPMADTILAALREAADGMTRDQIGRLFGWNKPSAEITGALGVMAAQGRARFERSGPNGSGRPTERWFAI